MSAQQNKGAQERPQLTVSISFERRIKELTNIISQCEMMIEMAKSEITTLQSNAQAALQQAQDEQAAKASPAKTEEKEKEKA